MQLVLSIASVNIGVREWRDRSFVKGKKTKGKIEVISSTGSLDSKPGAIAKNEMLSPTRRNLECLHDTVHDVEHSSIKKPNWTTEIISAIVPGPQAVAQERIDHSTRSDWNVFMKWSATSITPRSGVGKENSTSSRQPSSLDSKIRRNC